MECSPARARSTERSSVRRSGAWDVAIFALVFGVYFLSPVRVSNDSAFVLHRAYSLLHGDGGALDAMVMLAPDHHAAMLTPNGRIHSMYPIGPSLLALPVIAALDPSVPDLRAALLDTRTANEIETFIAAWIGALAAVLMGRLALRATSHRGVALLGVAIFAFASPMWSSASRGLWQHGPLVLFTLGAWLALWRAGDAGAACRRWLVVAGVLTAFAMISRPLAMTFVLVASIHALAVHRRDAAFFLAAGLAVAAAWFAFNWSTEGQLVSPYYLPGTFGTRGAWYERVLGQLVSPSRGLLIFSPIFGLAIVGPIAKWRRGALDRHDAFAIGATLSLLLLQLGTTTWWGGWSYGPRYMTDAVPFLTYLCIDPLERLAQRPRSWRRASLRVAVAALLLVSVAMHGNGATNRASLRWNHQPLSIGEPGQQRRLWDFRHPQFLHGPFELAPNRLGVALAHLGSPPAPRDARIAVFFNPAPRRPGFFWRMRAASELAVTVAWSARDVAEHGGAVRFDVSAWSETSGPRVLSIRSAGNEIARWSVIPDGRTTTQEIALSGKPLAPETSTAPLQIVADDAPGLLKIAIVNARRTP